MTARTDAYENRVPQQFRHHPVKIPWSGFFCFALVSSNDLVWLWAVEAFLCRTVCRELAYVRIRRTAKLSSPLIPSYSINLINRPNLKDVFRMDIEIQYEKPGLWSNVKFQLYVVLLSDWLRHVYKMNVNRSLIVHSNKNGQGNWKRTSIVKWLGQIFSLSEK